MTQGEGPDDSFLKAVWQQLDNVGIDVVLGKASDLAASGVPRLASLKGYAPKEKDWGSFTKEAWPYAFAQGRSGVLFAYRPSAVPKRLATKKAACGRPKLSLDEGCRFVRNWLAAAPENRVFLAFTNEDFESASKAKLALEKAGYVVFVFLKGKNEKPWASPALVGEVFAQATHRLVLDTLSARGSAGVRFESLCCEPYLAPSYPETALSKALAGQSK
ncbi:hypothetical protein [Bradyrhizobium sp. Ec3.3]|uniref:hypothetical protein n=1 Tax=Bradyrhizobium sp. Ec3.3 TaxID=189753 RepID=UPI0012EC5F51|nr:hypothetical protein [Bradyrhizobium sp. Ec3.3]